MFYPFFFRNKSVCRCDQAFRPTCSLVRCDQILTYLQKVLSKTLAETILLSINFLHIITIGPCYQMIHFVVETKSRIMKAINMKVKCVRMRLYYTPVEGGTYYWITRGAWAIERAGGRRPPFFVQNYNSYGYKLHRSINLMKAECSAQGS